VAFLGPRYSFTHEAAEKMFESAEFVEARSVREAISFVEAGKADYAVVPLENTVNGPVHETLDMLAETMLHINMCFEMRIRLVIAGYRDSKRVYGHIHALAAVERWLEENIPEAERIAVSSTSIAAEIAAREGTLCVCSEKAAKANGLEIVADDVGEPNNYTRFIALGWRDRAREGDRTALVVVLPDMPGSLYRFLEPFAQEGVNLTMIYSRPAKGKPWKYLFYIEVEGSRLEKHVQRALAEARKRSIMLKILGSYPITQA